MAEYIYVTIRKVSDFSKSMIFYKIIEISYQAITILYESQKRRGAAVTNVIKGFYVMLSQVLKQGVNKHI